MYEVVVRSVVEGKKTVNVHDIKSSHFVKKKKKITKSVKNGISDNKTDKKDRMKVSKGEK